jgi:DNA-binding winged helix-turn-helix (wHTH) protein/Tfp pilus assembly protein PilF
MKAFVGDTRSSVTIGDVADRSSWNSTRMSKKYFGKVPIFLRSTYGSTNMRSYRFGPYILDVQERRLLRDGEPIPLTPKVFDTLVCLVEHQGHLLSKDELMQAVWSNAYVEDGNLPRTIHVLRKALGNGDNGVEYIETIPTKGYRFVPAATPLPETPAPPEPVVAATQLEPQLQPRPRPSRRLVVGLCASLLLLAVAGSGWRAVERNHLARLVAQTDSGAAYTKFQEGRLHMERQHEGDHAAALEEFDAATKLDPHFAAAYAGKADAELFLYWDTGTHDDIAHARLAVNKAIELDPNNSYAHALLCRIRATYDWELAGAETECRRAVELDPNNHEARRELAFLLNATGRREDALKEMDIAIALAPTSFNKRSRGLLLYYARRFDEAIAQFKQVEATDPEFSESSRWIARCFEQKKDYTQALEFLVRVRQAEGARSEEIALLRNALADGGWPEVLRASLPKSQPNANMETAGTLAQLGENESAFEVLDGMVKARRVMIVHMDSDPRLDPLRADARFEQLAKRVGLR